MTASSAGIFFFGNAAALHLAAVCTSVLCRDRAVSVRWIATIGCYLLLTCLTTLVLGLAGQLHSWSPALVLVLGSLAAVALQKRHSARCYRLLVPDFDRERCRRELQTLLAPMLALMIGLLSIWAVKHTLLGTFLTFDDKTYHAPSLVSWMQSGRIELTEFSYQSYYPFNAELLSLWFMLPFDSDAAVPLTGLVYALLFVAISFEFGRRWRLPLWCRPIPAILFLSSIEVVSQSNWFADVDIAAPVVLLSALAIGCRDSSPALRRQVFFAGALAGFAVGMKSTFAPFAGILMVLVAGRLFLRCRISDAELPQQPSIQRLTFFATLGNGLGFFLCAVLAGGYWYLRNLALTGNPLFPAKVGPFSGPFGGREQYATTLANAITNKELDVSEYVAVGEMLFSWPATHAMLAAFSVVVSALAVARLRLGSRGAPAVTAVSLTVFAVVCLTIFPWMPFSARGDDGNFYLEGSSRYLTLAYLGGFLLFPRLLAWIESPEALRMEQWFVFFGLLLLLAIPLGLAIDTLFAFAGLLVAVVVLIVFQVFAFTEFGHRFTFVERCITYSQRTLAVPAILILVLLAALAATPMSHRKTSKMHLETWMYQKIEELPEGSRIAMFFGLRPEFYSLYGRHYQHVPVRLSANGTEAVALHLRADQHGGRNFFDYAFDRNIAVDPERFLANVHAAKIDFIVTPIMPHFDDAWPVQHAWLRVLAVPVFCHSDDAVIWDLRPDALAAGSEPLPEVAISDPS